MLTVLCNRETTSCIFPRSQSSGVELLVIVQNSAQKLHLVKGAEECPLLLASVACFDKACVYSVK